MSTPEELLGKLREVRYPRYSRDIVSFGMVKDVEVGDAAVTVVLAPGGARPDAVAQIRTEVERVLGEASGRPVRVVLEETEAPQRRVPAGRAEIPGVRHVIAVASGKGGVGKSTVAVNLALAMQQLGRRVGLLDADVYGPSVPMLLGLEERPRANEEGRITPLERFGLKTISMGLLIREAQPVMWRGPMVHKLLTQFLRDTEWGELDLLVLDLPPGTGDAQLTIAQQAPLSGGVIVTTPQDVALLDVRRGIRMFREVQAPILGVVENMSHYSCPSCGKRTDIFGHGGGARVAEELGIPFLGEIPIVRRIREAGDTGTPVVVADPEAPESRAFRKVAELALEELERQAPVSVLPVIR